MSAFERLRKGSGRAEQKQHQLDTVVLFSGFVLQSASEHNAFWLPELHRKSKTLGQMTLGPMTVIESVRRLEASSLLQRVEQPEPAPSCWQSAETTGPRHLTIKGIQDVVSAFCDYSVGADSPVIEAMPPAIAAQFEQQVNAASDLLANIAPSRIPVER